MRTAVMFLGLAACTPDIASGSYVCGPNATCPEGQLCNGLEDLDNDLVAETCVVPSLAHPFTCTPEVDVEPDNTMAEAYLIQDLGCVSAPFVNESCMPTDDSADWVTFVAPSVCTRGVEVEARLTFPVSYQGLALELWNVDANVKVADDTECPQSTDNGLMRRCVDFTLTPGTKYAVKVLPTGEGNCNGACSHNRYTLSVQLATPG